MRLNTKQLPSDCFDFRVSGIPCIVCVTHYEPTVAANLSGHPDNWSPPEWGEIEFELYDRKGYRAKWLEEKLTDSVEAVIFDTYEEHRRRDN
jgi:hypothetical protein